MSQIGRQAGARMIRNNFARELGRARLFTQKPLNKRQKKQVKRIVHGDDEPKFLDTYDVSAGAYVQVDRGGQLKEVTTVPQGDTVNTRDGDELRQNKLDFRLSAYYNPAVINTDAGHKLRVIVFRWLPTTALGAPGVANILQNVGGAVDYRAVVSPYNDTGTSELQFKPLYDKTFALNHAKDLYIHKVINLKNRKQAFGAGFTTGNNHIYVMLIADDATGAHTPDLQVQWGTRFWFRDI